MLTFTPFTVVFRADGSVELAANRSSKLGGRE
jgi:hypothetical protein